MDLLIFSSSFSYASQMGWVRWRKITFTVANVIFSIRLRLRLQFRFRFRNLLSNHIARCSISFSCRIFWKEVSAPWVFCRQLGGQIGGNVLLGAPLGSPPGALLGAPLWACLVVHLETRAPPPILIKDSLGPSWASSWSSSWSFSWCFSW